MKNLELIINKELTTNFKIKQLYNINAFSNLKRNKPLQFNKIERFLLLHTTSSKEKIYIKYPGKESARTKNKRPLDFRPVLKFKNGNFTKDMSFGDIWNDLSNLHSLNKDASSILASIFFRMAYMVDYKLTTEILEYFDVDIKSNIIINKGKIKFSYYKLDINQIALKYLNDTIGFMRDISITGYLLYNELLVQNEDCKYYYRSQLKNETNRNYKNGRINTMLSHLSVIEYLQGNIPFSEIMMRFQRGMGVAPIPTREIEIVTNKIIRKNN